MYAATTDTALAKTPVTLSAKDETALLKELGDLLNACPPSGSFSPNEMRHLDSGHPIFKLIPTGTCLTDCREYWDSLRFLLTQYHGTYYKIYVEEKNIPLSEVIAYAHWLQTTFGEVGMPTRLYYWAEHNRIEGSRGCWFQFWGRNEKRSLFIRLLIENMAKAIKQFKVNDRDLQAECYQFLVSQSGYFIHLRKASPVSMRNLAFASVEFITTTSPILQARFTNENLYRIHCNQFNLFKHWCYRKKRHLALALGFDKDLFSHLKAIPAIRPYRWLPGHLLPKVNEPFHLVETEETIVAISHLLKGEPVRTIPCLPKNFHLTAKAAHFFQNAPVGDSEFTFFRALIYGRVKASCDEDRLVQNLTNKFFYTAFFEDLIDYDHMFFGGRYLLNKPNFQLLGPFLEEVCAFFYRNREKILPAEVSPLLDYIFAEKKRNSRFTLTGRTPASLRRLMETWHRELNRQKELKGLPKSWGGEPMKDFHTFLTDGQTYSIVQITNQETLLDEGAAMRHCIVTYARGSVRGSHSIWSLRQVAGKEIKRLVTILLVGGKTITQARGFQNRIPDLKEVLIMKEWCYKNHLKYENDY